MTDAKDEKDSGTKDAPEPAKAAEAPAPEEPRAEAAAHEEERATAKAQGETRKAEPAAVERAEAAAPAVAHKAADAVVTPKAAATSPETGVRVRLTYSNGAPVEAASEPKSRLKPRRLLAEYETTADVIHAAESLRDAGYKAFEAHSPFPIHGMDAAMGLSDSKLGWIVLACGLTGVSSAWLMMFWMNGVDYPLVIGGKPPGTLPSMVPIMFELTVLLSSFGAVFGMFGLNRLPRHHDVLFYSDRFAAFSNDKFFISVDATDPKFDVRGTRQLLEKTKPGCIEVIETIEEVDS